MAHAVRIWDVQPYTPSERQLKVFRGNRHGFEKVRHSTYVVNQLKLYF